MYAQRVYTEIVESVERTLKRKTHSAGQECSASMQGQGAGR